MRHAPVSEATNAPKKPGDFPRSLVVHFEGEYLELHQEGHGEGLRVGEKRLEATYTLERVVEVMATADVSVPSKENKS